MRSNTINTGGFGAVSQSDNDSQSSDTDAKDLSTCSTQRTTQKARYRSSEPSTGGDSSSQALRYSKTSIPPRDFNSNVDSSIHTFMCNAWSAMRTRP